MDFISVKNLKSFCLSVVIIRWSIFRVDPKATCDKDDMAPIKKALMCMGGSSFDTEIFDMLSKATGDVPDDMKLELLSIALNFDLGEESDKERAKETFREVLGSLTPELVRVKVRNHLWLIVFA